MGGALESAQALFHLWSIVLNQAVYSCVVDIDTALFHHLFEIAIADGVPAILTNALENYLALEVTPFEVAHSLVLWPRLNPKTPIYIFRRITDMRIISAKREPL